MKPTTPKNGKASLRMATTHMRRYRLAAIGLIGLGLILLASSVGLLPRALMALGPVLILLAGVFVLLAGRARVGLPTAPFAIERGAYEAGHLLVEAGSADVSLDAFAGVTQLAVGQYPDRAGPRLRASVDGTRAWLSFDRRFIGPFQHGDWAVSLVRDLPWAATLRSDLGQFRLDLRNLNVNALDLRSLFGDAEMTLPVAGRGDFRVRLTFGDLTVHVPDGVAIRVRLTAGPLASARLMDPGLIQVSAREWVTPNFSACPNRFTLTLALSTGNLLVD